MYSDIFSLVRTASYDAYYKILCLLNLSGLATSLEELISQVGYHSIRLQTRLDDGTIRCDICNRRCVIDANDSGQCTAIRNAGSELISTNYGLIMDYLVSNIERYSLLHYLPCSKVLAIGSLFCNLRCLFCSGALHTHIKFLPFKYAPNLIKYRLQPSDVIALAKKEGVDGILFGGNEPTVHLDFVLDVASLAKEAGFYVAMETNGYMTEEAIDLLAPVIDAVAIGLKGFADPEIHERWLLEQPVDPTYILNSIKAFYSRGVHTEVSVLPVPNYRDADTYARITSKWIATNVNSHIPVEIQAIFPYCISDWIESDNLTPSDVERFVSICRDAGLTHVYSRSFSHDNLLTYCSTCGEAVVRREVIDQKSRYLVKSAISAYDKPIYTVELVGLKIVDGKGYCANCNTEIYGVWA